MTDTDDSVVLKKEIDRLKKENERLKQENDRIRKEFEEYKSLHNHTVEELRKALKIKANNKSIPKPAGLPIGHRGYARHIPGRIDRVK